MKTRCELLIERFNILNEGSYTGMIIKGDDGWNLSIDSIKFKKTYTDEGIKSVLNKTLKPDQTDFADDGCRYEFDSSKFDSYMDSL